MPSLNKLTLDGNLKILIYGLSGSGKTCLAAGFPGPILFMDFDGKVDSAAKFYSGQEDRLAAIEVKQLASNLTKSPIEELNRIVREELIPQQKTGEMVFKTLVIDSLTTFSMLTLNHILQTNPGIKRTISAQGQQPCMQDYGILRREFQKLIPGLLSLPCNVVMLGHISTEKDELTGELVRGPHMDGSFARDLPIYFKEVWRSFIDSKGQFMAQTKSDAKYSCRSQIKGLPDPLSLSYDEISKHL